MECILSYSWLAYHNIDVRCRRHGLVVHYGPKGYSEPLWVPGEVTHPFSTVPPHHNMVSTVQKRPPLPRNPTGPGVAYTVRWQVFHEIIRHLGVKPQRDLFASEGNQRCQKFYTKFDDALTQSWDTGEINWLNPPWELWPLASEKLLLSDCAAICILPAWSKSWVHKVVGASHRRVYFEKGIRIFEVEGRPSAGTFWGLWAVYLKKGPKVVTPMEKVLRNVIVVPKWKSLASMGVGGKEDEILPQEEIHEVRGPRALDLFSGTGSVSRALSNLGYNAISVDFDPKVMATHLVDIRDWDYKQYPQGHFQVIFACPPCTHFSQAHTKGTRDLHLADEIIQKNIGNNPLFST